MADNK